MCKNGIHLTEKPFKWFQWKAELYEAEYEGEIIKDPDESKCVVRKARLLRKCDPPTWWLDMVRFVERDIPSVNWLKPDRKPKKEWKLYKAKTWAAAGAAAGDAALIARLEIVQDLKVDKKHIDHANARWEIWQKGYALCCDMNGILYVYAKE